MQNNCLFQCCCCRSNLFFQIHIGIVQRHSCCTAGTFEKCACQGSDPRWPAECFQGKWWCLRLLLVDIISFSLVSLPIFSFFLTSAAHWTLVELCRGPREGESCNSHLPHVCILPGQSEREGMKRSVHAIGELALGRGMYFSSFSLPSFLLNRTWCLSTTSELCWADSLHGVLTLTRTYASLPLTVFTPCCIYSYATKVLFTVLNKIGYIELFFFCLTL